MDFNEYINKGIAFFQEGKIDQAFENLELALKLQPNNADLQQMIEGIKIQADAISKSAQLCINEAKHRAEVMSGLYGIKLEDITDIDRIITEYSRNSNHDSAKKILASAYYIRGLLFDSKRDYIQSAEAYSNAIKNEPDYPLAFNNRGWANLAIGNYDQAIEDFKKANLDEAELKKRIAGVYMKRGIEYDKKSDYANAARDYAKVLEFDPDNSTARELLEMAKNQI
jgi:tetratricopeptide (TPR) repeat protein